jgi:hemin uptake protein HemP
MNVITEIPQKVEPSEPPRLATYDARDLIPGGVQACITLDDQIYILRITRAGKLILTK